jgi:hypothetical protein
MKLSEAILLGSTMLAAKPGRQYFFEKKAGCALGMAGVASGCRFHRVTGPVAKKERRTLGAERVWGKWLLLVVMRPCECWNLRVPREMRIKDIIAHLFDIHVMKKKNWTLSQLVAWVQTWEPKEISQAPIANTVVSGKVISTEARVGQRLAEQEWHRVRQAFESRRSHEKISWWTSPGGTA